MWFLGLFRMSRQGLLPLGRNLHSSARNISVRHIFEGAASGARPVLAGSVEPRGHVLGGEGIKRYPAEHGQNAGLRESPDTAGQVVPAT